jgi:hypothetical protein
MPGNRRVARHRHARRVGSHANLRGGRRDDWSSDVSYDEFDVDVLLANNIVVGVVVRDSADGEIILNLPINGGLVGERQTKVMTMIRDLLSYCLDGEVAVEKGDSN